MPTLERRIDDLENRRDPGITIIRPCQACGELVMSGESRARGDTLPPCARGAAHAPLPPPTPRDVVIERSYGLAPREAR